MTAQEGGALYLAKSKADIEAEYEAVAQAPEDYLKAKWGSQESMQNRFRLGREVIGWTGVERWLDVGCGVGGFFKYVLASGGAPGCMVGVDICASLTAQAGQRPIGQKARFLTADLEALPAELGDFDLMTMLGVLQQCGARPEAALAACASRLRPGGQLFFTTKNARWEAFTSGLLTPEPSHSWFDPEELFAILRSLGLRLVQSGGFLPRENARTKLNASHSIYVLAVRPAVQP